MSSSEPNVTAAQLQRRTKRQCGNTHNAPVHYARSFVHGLYESQFRQMPRTDSSRNCSRTEQILRQKRVNCHHYCSCHMHHVSEIYTYTNLFPRNQIADALLNIACSRGSGVSVRLTLDRTNVFCESAAAVKCITVGGFSLRRTKHNVLLQNYIFICRLNKFHLYLIYPYNWHWST